jgi:hypothetical protein
MRRQAFIALWLAAIIAGLGAGSAFANSLAPTQPRISIPTPVQALRPVDVNIKHHTLDLRPRCETDQKRTKRGTAVRERACEFE